MHVWCKNHPGDILATRFQRGGIWYIKYKDNSGVWKNISCGAAATANDAEIIRKNYDSKELLNRHKIAVRRIETNLLEQLEVFKETEIPRSLTGRPRGRKSIVRNKAIVKNFKFWCEEKKHKKYDDLTPAVMGDFFDSIAKLAPSTLKKYRAILIQFFKWSIARSYCEIVPMDDIRAPKIDQPPPRFFTESEIKKIDEAAQSPYKNIFRWLYLTGMRIGEVGNMEWMHYIEHLKSLKIPVMEGNKTKREGLIPINKAAQKILDEQRLLINEKDDSAKYIFVNPRGRKLDNENIYKVMKRILKDLKILDASPHTYRHTTASHLAIKGVSLYVIKEILRHKSIKETERYAHLSRDATRNAVEMLE